MTNEICIDLECIPSQNPGKEMLEIARLKCARKRGENKNIETYCSLTPEFGQIICIGLKTGSNDSKDPVILSGSEKDILETFWALMFDHAGARIVGFNSKNFDIPYILKRSAILGIPPSAKLSTRKYDTQSHYDLLEVLSNFGSSEYLSLSAYCKIFSIPHNDKISGADTHELWKSGNLAAIEKHCRDDIISTWQLYNRIKHYF
ncbi:MAG: ribonuclease H-like domain-containing protein [Candidatus Methanoperedens sp.]|nr:ribonuclease H-like domain-containing protein [Candidatus Methanoperedens sp.]